MRETSARLLRMLSLLQMRKEWSGSELAERLAITPRTVRRDIEKLRDLGYPVDSAVGVGGGYRLGAGAEMPPLLLDDDEVVAVAFGLQSGASGSVVGIGDASMRALAKLRQVMPSRLRHRLAALEVDVVARGPAASAVDASTLAAVASVCHNRERLRFDYRTYDGQESRREVEPYRLVRSGMRWYLVAWDLDREDWRSFRIDRLTPKIPTGPRYVPRELPDGGAAAFVARGIERATTHAQAQILLHAPFERIAPMIHEDWATLEERPDDRCAVHLRGESLRSIANWLSAFEVDFTIESPEELRVEARAVAEEHRRLADRYGGA
ncbi:YafY family transcriptional regulator [Rhodococcus triatomae]|uniref:Predicted DNA-binding transcriptional regulator YafY, contains an HTH and WYL domains n=1 Tax=Rhodococcus triatomae TaxID=300028 RepID=A0A1G8A2L0_9NOCA|nr:YafY family protein [Rhodococcus triatomae]QNG17876.1 YafY family transcriptional regulator [Rhodococcus triatomae]QNG22456.1 YafY family transcriptional regulator [Rhodococcus triatomae]SDH15126.1 Predicted DNA-binding transcriptional regulator YafY, contains an HTH and WYL domains [Rhodococcus triatomae]